MKCKLCPNFKGAIVQVDSGNWYHLACVNNFKEIWFEEITDGDREFVNTNKIVNENELDDEYFKLTCSVCKITSKNHGACI